MKQMIANPIHLLVVIIKLSKLKEISALTNYLETDICIPNLLTGSMVPHIVIPKRQAGSFKQIKNIIALGDKNRKRKNSSTDRPKEMMVRSV